jgi:hypothetical protein
MFLPFGTLAPGLLLSLFAFAYMLLFGSYALNKTAAKSEADNHEVRLTAAPGQNSAEGSSSCYFLSQDDLTAQGITEDTDAKVMRQVITRIIHIPDKKHIPDHHLLSHFTRPPPSLNQA